ncbi:MAG: hypothetical protein AAF466_10330 [Bacteroidota bacterium]
MRVFLFLSLLCYSIIGSAQMNNDRLEQLLSEQVDSIVGIPGRWQATYKEQPLIILTDETNDRMRIITPVAEVESLDETMLLNCLTANFHTALDVKYAISNDLLWCVFIHPLGDLTEKQLSSAIQQVYSGAITFGTTYSSTELLFGGSNSEEKPKPKLKKT